MGFIERLNRILVSSLLFLVFIQVGLLFFLKSLQDEAQYRLVKNTTKAQISCGKEQFSNENYWPVLQKTTTQTLCVNGDCPISELSWNRSEQNKEFHVVSLMSPPQTNWETMEQGGVVKIHLKKSAKPQIVALVSRTPLQWDFVLEPGVRLEKVIVATPTTAWLNGLATNVPIEYLPKEKMCSYPYTWHDAFNHDNEFRTLVGALYKVSGLYPNTFQGAQLAKEFTLAAPLAARGLASVPKVDVAGEEAQASGPLKWQRLEGRLVADKYTWSATQIHLPPKTTQTLEAFGQLYAVVNGYLEVWNEKSKAFVRVETSYEVVSLDEVMAIAAIPDSETLVIYNEQRGGEFYSFSPQTKKWTLLSQSFKYNLNSLSYDAQTKNLVALVSRGSHFAGLVSLAMDGKILEYKELPQKIPFDKKRWRWSLEKNNEGWQVRVFTPAAIQGQNFTF